MIYGIGDVSRIIVVVEINIIMNHNGAAVTTVIAMVVIIIIMVVNPDCHYGKSCKIRRVVPVIIWGIIWYVNG
jgi:hypothetical protein